jgi:hypothetical protein
MKERVNILVISLDMTGIKLWELLLLIKMQKISLLVFFLPVVTATVILHSRAVLLKDNRLKSPQQPMQLKQYIRALIEIA